MFHTANSNKILHKKTNIQLSQVHYICSMNKIGFLFLMVCMTHLTKAQHIDILRTGFKYGPSAKSESGAALINASASVDVLLPLQRENGDAVLAGFNAEYAMLQIENSPAQHYYPTRFVLGYQKQLKSGNKFTALFLPSIKSNWQNINSNHLQNGIYARYDWYKTKNLKWQFGGYFNTELASLFFVPIISLNYYGSKNWHFYGVFPVNYNIMRNVGDRTRLGIRYQGLMNSIYTEVNGIPGYWERAPIELFLAVEHYFTPRIVGRFMAGHSVMRTMNLYDFNQQSDFRISAVRFGDNRNANYSAGDSFLFEFSLFYRYDLSDS